MIYSQTVDSRTWTVCGPVFQEIVPIVQKYQPFVKFHDFDHLIDLNFFNDSGKIIIFSQVGDYLEYNKIKSVLDDNLQYYKQTGKKKNYFIYLSINNYLEDWSQYSDILKIYYIPEFYQHYNNVLKVDESRIIPDIQHHFLSLNSRISRVRASLFGYFYRKKYLEKSIFTFRTRHPGGHSEVNMRLNNIDYYLNEYNFNKTTDTSINIEELSSHIPYIRKNDEGGPNGNDPYFSNLDWYNKTFINLTVETYTASHMGVFFTEKIFKPIIAKQPFLLFGSKYSLKLLQDLGFKTFSPFIDESYDNMDQPNRFEAILNEIDKISNYTITELSSLRNQMLPILNHNYEHMINSLPAIYLEKINTISKEIEFLIQKEMNTLRTVT